MKNLSKRQKVLLIITAVWTLYIWIHSMQTATISDDESLGFMKLINSIMPFHVTNHMVRKAAHFTEYFILGIFSGVSLASFKSEAKALKAKIYLPLLTGFLTAFLDETIQLFVEGRSGQISDVWLDFSGCFFAVILTCGIILAGRKRLAKQ